MSCCGQELTAKKSLLTECEMKCHNLQAALSETQALIKVLSLLWLVHTADTDQTELSCLIRVGGVNKLLMFASVSVISV